jgi:hypothetical protein
MDSITPALLTRSEIEYLQGQKQVSMEYERQIRSRISRKLRTFQKLESPLLIRRGFNVTTDSHIVTTDSHAEPTGDFGHGISDVNIMCEAKSHSGRGSPSLVGRGIANPMSERTRGFESHSPRLLVLGSILDKAERTSIINPMTPIQKKDQRQSC